MALSSITVLQTSEHKKEVFEGMKLRREASEHVGEPGQRAIIITQMWYLRRMPGATEPTASDGIEFITVEGNLLRWNKPIAQLEAMSLWTSGDWYTLDATIIAHSLPEYHVGSKVHVPKHKSTRIQVHGFKHRAIWAGPSDEVY